MCPSAGATLHGIWDCMTTSVRQGKSAPLLLGKVVVLVQAVLATRLLAAAHHTAASAAAAATVSEYRLPVRGAPTARQKRSAAQSIALPPLQAPPQSAADSLNDGAPQQASKQKPFLLKLPLQRLHFCCRADTGACVKVQAAQARGPHCGPLVPEQYLSRPHQARLDAREICIAL